jgi:hypothetical protein
VAVVVGKLGSFTGLCTLDGRSVRRISAFLDEDNELSPPTALAANLGLAFKGVDTGGLGFVVSHVEEGQILQLSPNSGQLIWPFINGDDLLSSPECEASRRIINFTGLSLREASAHQELMSIVKERVLPHRLTVNRKANRDNWWLYNWPRPELYSRIAHLDQVLVNCVVAKYVCFAFLEKRQVFSNALNVFVIEDYWHFGVLQSSIHDSWSRNYGSTLETRHRYNPTDCFETFPFPGSVHDPGLTQIGRDYHSHRAMIQASQKIGLT